MYFQKVLEFIPRIMSFACVDGKAHKAENTAHFGSDAALTEAV